MLHFTSRKLFVVSCQLSANSEQRTASKIEGGI